MHLVQNKLKVFYREVKLQITFQFLFFFFIFLFLINLSKVLEMLLGVFVYLSIHPPSVQ